MKNEKLFNQNTDIVTIRLTQANDLVSINQNASSASLYAGSANTYATVIQASGTSASLSAYDARGSVRNVSITGLFQQISSFFFGRNDSLIPHSSAAGTTVSTAKVIFINRPSLDQGIKPRSVTANISNGGTSNLINLNIIDIPATTSTVDLKLGQTGILVLSGITSNQIGSIFYDYGVMVFHGGNDSATANMFITNTSYNTNFYWGNPTGTSVSSITAQLNINALYYQTQKNIVRNYYYCRVFNNEFNYTSNPTSKKSNGELLDTIIDVPSSYITTIGLYNDNDECLAVAKVSPAVRKNISTEHTFQVSLDF